MMTLNCLSEQEHLMIVYVHLVYTLPTFSIKVDCMLRWVVEFLDGVYKISDIFAWKSTPSKEILILCKQNKI